MEQHIAAMVDVVPEAEGWEEAGRKLGELMDATVDHDDLSHAVIRIEDTSDESNPEEVLISIPGLLYIYVQRWQLEKALYLSRKKKEASP